MVADGVPGCESTANPAPLGSPGPACDGTNPSTCCWTAPDYCYDPPPPPPPPPVVIAEPEVSVSFDPHLNFAHGGKADFRGDDHSWYNLLSASNVSLNALFTHEDFKLMKPKKQLVHGSRMEQLCMTVRTDTGRVVTIEYNATASVPFVVLVHQRSEPAHHLTRLTSDKKYAREYKLDNVKLSLKSKKVGLVSNAGHGMTLTIDTGNWEVTATSKAFGKEQSGKALLNIKLKALYDADSDPVAPHGLIGQSYDGDDVKVDGKLDDYAGDEVTTKAMAEGAIEGVGSDYKMASRFDTAFKYSRFDATSAKPRDVNQLAGIKSKATSKGGEIGAAADVEEAEMSE
jgi:hypothetical protein